MKKVFAAAAAVILSIFLFSSCVADNHGTIKPVPQSAIDYEQLDSIDWAPLSESEIFAFDYQWEKMAPEARVWLEVYRNGEPCVESPVEVYRKDLTGDAGTIYLLAHGGETPWWTVGFTNEDSTSGSSTFVYNDPGDFPGSFPVMKPILPDGSFDLLSSSETIVAALLYRKDGDIPSMTLNKLANQPDLLKNIDLAVFLKCAFSPGRLKY